MTEVMIHCNDKGRSSVTNHMNEYTVLTKEINEATIATKEDFDVFSWCPRVEEQIIPVSPLC